MLWCTWEQWLEQPGQSGTVFHGLAQPTSSPQQAGLILLPHHHQGMMCSGRSGRKEGSRSTPKIQKITKGKGWFLSRYLTLLFADGKRHTMKSSWVCCRIFSIIRVRKKVYDMSSLQETPWNEKLVITLQSSRKSECCCPHELADRAGWQDAYSGVLRSEFS